MRAITIEREDALDALALDRMRNARKAVKEVKDIESVANEALRQILDINTNRNEFLDDAGASENIQNRKAKENERRHQQLDRDEQNLLKLFNDAQRNEASSRATAEQAHKSAGQVFNLSKQSAAVHQHAIDKETLKCTLCHQSIDPIKQKETFEQLKRDAEVMRLKHVAAIEALNDSRVKLDQFQLFKKSEIERMLNEERALQNLKFARVEKENKKMMLTNELRRLVSLLVNVSERFSQMLPYVPEEVLALEKSFGDDGDALRLERRKRREQEQEQQQSTKYAALPLRVSRRNGERLYQASFPDCWITGRRILRPLLEDTLPLKTTKTILRVKTTVSFRTTSSSRITSHRSRNSSTSTTHPDSSPTMLLYLPLRKRWNRKSPRRKRSLPDARNR